MQIEKNIAATLRHRMEAEKKSKLEFSKELGIPRLLRRFGGVQGQLGHHVVAHIISPPYFGFEFVLFRAF